MKPLKRKNDQSKIVVLIDFENLLQNTEIPPPKSFSMMAGFDKLIKEISQDVGEIINVFVFIPPNLAITYGAELYKQGFFMILCPKIQSKKGSEEDTVDSTLIEFGKKIIGQSPDLTHLCIGSGDKDFNPLIREAIRWRLKIIIIAGNLRSLSFDLIKLADKKTGGKGKMVYLFTPEEQYFK